MRVLVAMSGGVDSSVAAALLVEAGHQVDGATMKLWGGEGDSGCCSVADVEDARRVAQQLGIRHHVFNFTDDFERRVVGHYVAEHTRGRTPNPCVECNRHLKFDRLPQRAVQLGFDAVATGHHARVRPEKDGRWELRRGADGAKDQSYVLSMLGQEALGRCRFPVGELTKAEVRAKAASLGLRTAAKPDSQDVCFILAGGRAAFLSDRADLHPGALVDADTGEAVGTAPALELLTPGQRRGLHLGGGTGGPRYVLSVDVAGGRAVVGGADHLLTDEVLIEQVTWVDAPVAAGTPVAVQTSAHGAAAPAVFAGDRVCFSSPHRRVAPGQTVAFYDGDRVLGGALAA